MPDDDDIAGLLRDIRSELRWLPWLVWCFMVVVILIAAEPAWLLDFINQMWE